jgi:hypothetical protein
VVESLLRITCLATIALLPACGKDNFGVTMSGCDSAANPQKVFQCATFEHKPWSYGLDEFYGFYVAKGNAQPFSEHLLRTLSEAKVRGRYVSIGGETPDLLLAAHVDTRRLWEESKPDLAGLLVQVHSDTSVQERAIASLRAVGVQPKFYVLKKPAA